jgi:hypothetical protein
MLASFRQGINRAGVASIAGIGLLLYLYGFGLFCFQAYFWFRSGTWVPLPAISLLMENPPVDDRAGPAGFTVDQNGNLRYLGEPYERAISHHRYPPFRVFRRFIPYLADPEAEEWLRQPRSWFGLHKMIVGLLNLLSVPVVAIAVGLPLDLKALDELLDQSGVLKPAG